MSETKVGGVMKVWVLASDEPDLMKEIDIPDHAQVAIVNEGNFFYDGGRRKFPENQFTVLAENTKYEMYVIRMTRSNVSTQYGQGQLVSVVQLVVADKPFKAHVRHAVHNVKWGSDEPDYAPEDESFCSYPMSDVAPILKLKESEVAAFIASLKLTH